MLVRSRGYRDEAVGTNKDILVLCHDGPIRIFGIPNPSPRGVGKPCAVSTANSVAREVQIVLSKKKKKKPTELKLSVSSRGMYQDLLTNPRSVIDGASRVRSDTVGL